MFAPMFDFGASVGRSVNLNSEPVVLVEALDRYEPLDSGLGSAGGFGLG